MSTLVGYHGSYPGTRAQNGMKMGFNGLIAISNYTPQFQVLHLASENEEETLQATMKLVEERSNLTAAELARAVSLSPLLARERLLALEELGLVCRDDTEAGLRFYPNLFLTRT
ncbi:ESCRT-II complex subunit VPS36 [Clonorchis sinensis]|uniref:Vacuolar protein-sorting-associated protein 36 n=1 Tax=Clonorchis sinensis TaxID=79923 RepID=G7YLF4_CLOSI|nr:ESCRT-II complex subunit VPS36 [Clonorchis sinensis]